MVWQLIPPPTNLIPSSLSSNSLCFLLVHFLSTVHPFPVFLLTLYFFLLLTLSCHFVSFSSFHFFRHLPFSSLHIACLFPVFSFSPLFMSCLFLICPDLSPLMTLPSVILSSFLSPSYKNIFFPFHWHLYVLCFSCNGLPFSRPSIRVLFFIHLCHCPIFMSFASLVMVYPFPVLLSGSCSLFISVTVLSLCPLLLL